VDGADATLADAASALADVVVDVGGGELRLIASPELGFVQTFLNAALAAGEFLAYLGVHSKSLQVWGDEHWLNTHQTPEMTKDFEFFHEPHAA
jgi:hypothetical protein